VIDRVFLNTPSHALLLACAVSFALAAVQIGPAVAQGPTETEGPVIHDDIEYLDVTGNSKRELIEALDRLSVPDDTGKRFYGHTHWELRWNYNVASEGAECRVTAVTATLDMTMSLPRWDPPRNADPALVRTWNAFVAGLREHEEGHRDIALAAAQEITRRIEAIPPAANCAKLKRTVGIRANSLLDEYREKGRRYDKATDHGRAQGAVLR
jgi:predicted secreted Zn-dependent protease